LLASRSKTSERPSRSPSELRPPEPEREYEPTLQPMRLGAHSGSTRRGGCPPLELPGKPAIRTDPADGIASALGGRVKRVRRWWSAPRIPMIPVWRLRLAWLIVIASVIGWPLSAMTWASDEPQFVLGLRWLAITFTAIDVLSTSDVRAEQDGEDARNRT
jgi:hypothetical protein